jgi:hypothetical protein
MIILTLIQVFFLTHVRLKYGEQNECDEGFSDALFRLSDFSSGSILHDCQPHFVYPVRSSSASSAELGGRRRGSTASRLAPEGQSA